MITLHYISFSPVTHDSDRIGKKASRRTAPAPMRMEAESAQAEEPPAACEAAAEAIPRVPAPLRTGPRSPLRTARAGSRPPAAAAGPAQGRRSPVVAGPALAQAEAGAASRSSAGVVPALAQACSARRSQAAGRATHAQVADAPVCAQAAGPAARAEATGRAARTEAAGALTCA